MSQTKTDSLYKRSKENCHDTTRVKIHYRLGMIFEETEYPDSAIAHLRKAISLSQKINFKRFYINAVGELGYFFLQINEIDSALVYLNKAYSEIEDKGNQKYLEIMNSLGAAYYYKGDYLKAYNFYLKYLKEVEVKGNPYQTARANSNVGVILKEQRKYDDALVFFKKSLQIALDNKSFKNQYIAYVNIGNVYADKTDNGRSLYNSNMALEYYGKAKKLLLEKNEPENNQNIIILLGNIGNIYADLRKFDLAVNEYQLALSFLEKTENFASSALIYNNLASVYVDMNKLTEADKYLKLGFKASEESGSPNDFLNNYIAAARYFEVAKKFKEAYFYHVRLKELNDSIFSTDAAEKRKELEMSIEYEKKEAEAKILQEKKELVAEEEKKKQLILLYAFVGGFALMLVVAFLIFRGYRQKQKSNEIILQQKHLVEEKQKEILDSIRYAKRIQQSLLPTSKYIDKSLNKLKN